MSHGLATRKQRPLNVPGPKNTILRMSKPPKPPDRPPSPRFKRRTETSRRAKTPSLKVTKSRPTSEESEAAWKEIREASPRAAAILAATYVESLIRFAIESRFVALTDDERKPLHSASGPLSSFSQAVELGFALGLYGQVIHRDLTIIRIIRNAFAHTMKPLTFDTPDIANAIADLQYLKTVKGKVNPPIEGIADHTLGVLMERGMVFTTNRDKYIETCMFIASDVGLQIDFDHRPTKLSLP